MGMRSSTRTTRLDCIHTYVHLLSHPCLTCTYYHTFAPCHIIVPPGASSCLILLPLSLPLMCQVAMQECQSDLHPLGEDHFPDDEDGTIELSSTSAHPPTELLSIAAHETADPIVDDVQPLHARSVRQRTGTSPLPSIPPPEPLPSASSQPAEDEDEAEVLTADDEGEDAEPPPLPTEAEIQAVFAQNEVAWTDEQETVLQGTAKTDVDAVCNFLDRMGVDYGVLHVPERTYTLQRSTYGAKVLLLQAEMPGGDEDWNDIHDGDSGDGMAEDPPGAIAPPEQPSTSAQPPTELQSPSCLNRLQNLLSQFYGPDLVASIVTSHILVGPQASTVEQQVLDDLARTLEVNGPLITMPMLMKKMGARTAYVVPNGDCCVRDPFPFIAPPLPPRTHTAIHG